MTVPYMLQVYGEMNDRVRDAVISLVSLLISLKDLKLISEFFISFFDLLVIMIQIDKEREGEQIDQALVKNVLNIYVEMDEDSMKYYAKDFEESMLNDTTIFYSKKASDWIASKSYADYMLKVPINSLLCILHIAYSINYIVPYMSNVGLHFMQVEECLKNEEARSQSYLRYGTKHKLLGVCWLHCCIF